jgi:hypothetical protein
MKKMSSNCIPFYQPKKKVFDEDREAINNLKNKVKNFKNEKVTLNNLFDDYKIDISKTTADSTFNLTSNNLTEEKIYDSIYYIIKNEDSSSSEEIDLDEDNQPIQDLVLDNNRLTNCYKDFEFIGKGGFGVVLKAKNKIDESVWAIKIMHMDLDLDEQREDVIKKKNLKVIQEIKAMLKFKKKNIVRYKTCWFELNTKKIKKKRKRKWSIEEKSATKNNEKKDKIDNSSKLCLERIQTIREGIKKAEKQNKKLEKKKKKRRLSMVWGVEEDEDEESLGANKNFIIKEEGEEKYTKLDDDKEEEEEEEEENDEEKEKEENEDTEKHSNSSLENEESEEIMDINENDSSKIDSNKSISKLNNNLNQIKPSKDTLTEEDDEYLNLRKNAGEAESSSNNLQQSNSNLKFKNKKVTFKKNDILDENSKSGIKNTKKANNSDDDCLGYSNKNKNRKIKKYPIYFFIQMEYCSGCPMNYYLAHRTSVPQKLLTTYMFYQMCKAVKHIHAGNMIHRDLKPGNIFIMEDYLIKIGDFGLALTSTKPVNVQGGTYLYQSPEQINNKPYTAKIDIFALGVILVELVSKFNTEFERRETLKGLKDQIYPEYLKTEHPLEYNLVKKLTRTNPNERPNINEILKDNDFIKLVQKSLE